MVTRPRLWLKTTSEKGPHLSCVVFTKTTRRTLDRKTDKRRKGEGGGGGWGAGGGGDTG